MNCFLHESNWFRHYLCSYLCLYLYWGACLEFEYVRVPQRFVGAHILEDLWLLRFRVCSLVCYLVCYLVCFQIDGAPCLDCFDCVAVARQFLLNLTRGTENKLAHDEFRRVSVSGFALHTGEQWQAMRQWKLETKRCLFCYLYLFLFLSLFLFPCLCLCLRLLCCLFLACCNATRVFQTTIVFGSWSAARECVQHQFHVNCRCETLAFSWKEPLNKQQSRQTDRQKKQDTKIEYKTVYFTWHGEQ